MDNLYRQISEFFAKTIYTEDFILALDESGVWLFTDSINTKQVLVAASRLMNRLQLDVSEIVLCAVNQYYTKQDLPAFSRECDLEQEGILYKIHTENLEIFIRTLTGVRGDILQKSILAEVADCYQDIKEVYTQLEEELMGLGLSKEQAKKIQTERPVSLQQFEDVGLSPSDAEEIRAFIQARNRDVDLQEGRIVSCIKELSQVNKIMKKRSKLSFGYTCVSIVTGIFALLNRSFTLPGLTDVKSVYAVWLFQLICSVVSLSYALSFIKYKGTFSAKLLLLFSYFAFIFSFWMPLRLLTGLLIEHLATRG